MFKPGAHKKSIRSAFRQAITCLQSENLTYSGPDYYYCKYTIALTSLQTPK